MVDQIRIVEEDQAQGTVQQTYLDIKRTMAVPFVGDIFKACAAYPPFLEAVWWEVKPLIGTPAFEGLADRIRAHSDACARRHLYVPDHTAALEARGMASKEIDRIRDTVEVFHRSDPRLLVIASAVRESLRKGPVGSVAHKHAPRQQPSHLKFPLPLKPVSPAMTDAGAGQVLEDLQHAIDMPFVPTDFALLANWPDYLTLVWDDVKSQVRTTEFRRHRDELYDIAVGGLRELPRLVRVDATAVRGAGITQAQLGEIYNLVDLLAKVTASLVSSIALLRLGLNAVSDEDLLELEAGA